MIKSPTKQQANQPTSLIDLVNYQQHTIVSRTILNKKTGSITLFAFDEGQGLSEHTAPFDAFVYILDGEAEVTVSGKKSYVHTGEFLIFPANKPHALHAKKPFKMMLIMIQS